MLRDQYQGELNSYVFEQPSHLEVRSVPDGRLSRFGEPEYYCFCEGCSDYEAAVPDRPRVYVNTPPAEEDEVEIVSPSAGREKSPTKPRTPPSTSPQCSQSNPPPQAPAQTSSDGDVEMSGVVQGGGEKGCDGAGEKRPDEPASKPSSKKRAPTDEPLTAAGKRARRNAAQSVERERWRAFIQHGSKAQGCWCQQKTRKAGETTSSPPVPTKNGTAASVKKQPTNGKKHTSPDRESEESELTEISDEDYPNP